MKIAYVLGQYPSLSETFIAREIEALKRRGFDIEVWALEAGGGARQIPQLSSAQCLAKPLGKFLPSQRAKYWRHVGAHWAVQNQTELKNVQHIHAGWASHPAFIAWGASEVLGVPWSFFGHARDLWVEGESLGAKLRGAKFAACCTREGTAYLQSLAPEFQSKVLYAPHGLEISDYEFRAHHELHEPIRVLAVGRLVEKKGFEELLLDFSLLSSYSRYEFELQVIGDGPLRGHLHNQAKKFGVLEHIRFAGALPHQQVIAAMQQSDLLVMPSRIARDGDRDGLPNVLLEAAACGLPIVSTRAGSITDFLDEDCAWLCSPDDAKALAQTIKSALSNYDESLRRAAVARERVAHEFDVDKNVEILARVFES